MQRAGRLADRANCPQTEEERRCARPREVQRNASVEHSHIVTLLAKILDKRLRERAEHELGEELLGFRKGRGITSHMVDICSH